MRPQLLFPRSSSPFPSFAVAQGGYTLRCPRRETVFIPPLFSVRKEEFLFPDPPFPPSCPHHMVATFPLVQNHHCAPLSTKEPPSFFMVNLRPNAHISRSLLPRPSPLFLPRSSLSLEEASPPPMTIPPAINTGRSATTQPPPPPPHVSRPPSVPSPPSSQALPTPPATPTPPPELASFSNPLLAISATPFFSGFVVKFVKKGFLPQILKDALSSCSFFLFFSFFPATPCFSRRDVTR